MMCLHDKGFQIHDEISRQGVLPISIVLGHAIGDMYVKCDALPKVGQMRNGLPSQSAISWSVLHGEHMFSCVLFVRLIVASTMPMMNVPS